MRHAVLTPPGLSLGSREVRAGEGWWGEGTMIATTFYQSVLASRLAIATSLLQRISRRRESPSLAPKPLNTLWKLPGISQATADAGLASATVAAVSINLTSGSCVPFP